MATKLSEALQNVKVENDKLVKQQLKDLQAHVQKQNLELERFKARNKENLILLQKKRVTREARLKDRQTQNIQRHRRAIETDVANFNRKSIEDIRQLQRMRENKERQLAAHYIPFEKESSYEFKKEDKLVHKAELQYHAEEIKNEKFKQKDLPKKER